MDRSAQRSLHRTCFCRWCFVKDTFIAYSDPEQESVKGVMLFDSTLSISHINPSSNLIISNSSRRWVLDARGHARERVDKVGNGGGSGACGFEASRLLFCSNDRIVLNFVKRLILFKRPTGNWLKGQRGARCYEIITWSDSALSHLGVETRGPAELAENREMFLEERWTNETNFLFFLWCFWASAQPEHMRKIIFCHEKVFCCQSFRNALKC